MHFPFSTISVISRHFSGFALLVLLINTSTAQITSVKVQNDWQTDRGKSLVPLSEYEAFIPRDALVALPFPASVLERVGKTLYAENEPLAVVKYKSVEKAYPLKYLLHHGIINDRMAGIGMAVTFCPLTYALKAYRTDKLQSGLVTPMLKLGNTGMLRFGNYVLYDENTESWWQQFTGKCLTGEWAGESLPEISVRLMDLKTYFKVYPFGLVMKPVKPERTGIDYEKTPYHRFEDIRKERPIYFPYDAPEQLPAMQKVVVCTVADQQKIMVPFTALQEGNTYHFTAPSGNQYVLFYLQSVHSVTDQRDILSSEKEPSIFGFSTWQESGESLRFTFKEGVWADTETQSAWQQDGKCTDGKLIGKRLKPIKLHLAFAYAALSFYPQAVVLAEGN